MNKTTITILTAALLTSSVFAYRSSEKDSEKMYNRYWINQFPREETDLTYIFALVGDPDDGAGIGIEANVSQWHIDQDMYIWSSSEDESEGKLVAFFPQTDTQKEFGFKMYNECVAPAPFELCLELTFEGKTKRLYSNDDLVVDGASDLKSIMNKLEK